MNGDELTSGQRAKFHAMVRDISNQVVWAEEYMTEEEWKRLFLGAAYGQRPMPNPFDPHAPFVIVNNERVRGMKKMTMAELITMVEVFGQERGVKWSEEQAAA